MGLLPSLSATRVCLSPGFALAVIYAWKGFAPEGNLLLFFPCFKSLLGFKPQRIFLWQPVLKQQPIFSTDSWAHYPALWFSLSHVLVTWFPSKFYLLCLVDCYLPLSSCPTRMLMRAVENLVFILNLLPYAYSIFSINICWVTKWVNDLSKLNKPKNLGILSPFDLSIYLAFTFASLLQQLIHSKTLS